jgi:hypothetical protein
MLGKLRKLMGLVPFASSALCRGFFNIPLSNKAPRHKNVIAFSLWGDSPRYWIGALRNVELAQTYYPGWFCRFYLDRRAPRERLLSLRRSNVEIYLMKRCYGFDGAFWRFSAAADPAVNVAIFRDCDSRIGRREATAVDAWLRSGKEFHIMRDHPAHSFPILAGMWGCRGGTLPNIDKLIARWTLVHWRSLDYKGCDQKFLAERVYPLIAGRALEHSEFDLIYGTPTSHFPLQREDCEFVGEVFDEHERWNEDERRFLAESLQGRFY